MRWWFGRGRPARVVHWLLEVGARRHVGRLSEDQGALREAIVCGGCEDQVTEGQDEANTPASVVTPSLETLEWDHPDRGSALADFDCSPAVPVDSFTIYRGYEVGLGRVAALVYFLLAAAIGYLGVKLIRSSRDRRHTRSQ